MPGWGNGLDSITRGRPVVLINATKAGEEERGMGVGAWTQATFWSGSGAEATLWRRRRGAAAACAGIGPREERDRSYPTVTLSRTEGPRGQGVAGDFLRRGFGLR